ncbi:hypothetical protein H6P81_009792 [Aristolochia fimbriata]|uniref:Uncharacterized protein n=1 Tax=Aristolochia fimbriata TaxID=158543 RepID=A0AAV7ELX7_ARIFI|nr:hypothetical protein H6P81_009792 [Aristolochia fimbriata]
MDKKTGENAVQDVEVRKGPWTMEEDLILINYIANHGEGVWNTLARSAGLKRTGKSCRLRWLNYLRPDVRRGNITPEEQMLIMELHARWGNRWSKIARHLPGRTDNEIKNYWRTRIQKQMKQAEAPYTTQNKYISHGVVRDHHHHHHDHHHVDAGAGASHSCGTSDGLAPETYSPMCLESASTGNPDAFQQPSSAAAAMSADSAEGFWSVEDLWSNE